jgi:hypothetical protein
MTDLELHGDKPLTPEEAKALAASDFRGAFGWIALGVAVLIGSITMDRLERQGINPNTIPGLLPGCLGVAMILLGALLGIRSWRRGGAARGAHAISLDRTALQRLGLVLGLIVVYSVVLVGHGLPFWLGSALYVAISIVTLQQPQREALGRSLSLRDTVFAVVVGLGSGLVITYVFQELFLVRLP